MHTFLLNTPHLPRPRLPFRFLTAIVEYVRSVGYSCHKNISKYHVGERSLRKSSYCVGFLVKLVRPVDDSYRWSQYCLPRYHQHGQASFLGLPTVDIATATASFPPPSMAAQRATHLFPIASFRHPAVATQRGGDNPRHKSDNIRAPNRHSERPPAPQKNNLSRSRTVRMHTASDNPRGANSTFQSTEPSACSFLRRRLRVLRGSSQCGSSISTRSLADPDASGALTAHSTARTPALRPLWRKPPENRETASAALPTFAALAPTPFFDRHGFSCELRPDNNRAKTGGGPARAAAAAAGGDLLLRSFQGLVEPAAEREVRQRAWPGRRHHRIVEAIPESDAEKAPWPLGGGDGLVEVGSKRYLFQAVGEAMHIYREAGRGGFEDASGARARGKHGISAREHVVSYGKLHGRFGDKSLGIIVGYILQW